MSSDQDVFNDLKENYKFYYKDLVSFVEWSAGGMKWTSGDPQTLPGGWTPEDVAQHIILKTLKGERKYDPGKGSLRNWLRYQARSVLSALVKSASHRHETDLPEEEIVSDKHSTNPEQSFSEKEHYEIVSQNVATIFEVADSDPDLLSIVEAIADGCEPKPRFLAEALNVDVEEINNRLRRLRRLGRKVNIHDESEE